MRIVSVLMGWGMEDALERSEAMRARGYECGAKRTTYKRLRVHVRDAVVVGFVLVLAATSVVSAWAVCSRYSFYPVAGSVAFWWGYILYALFMFLPVILRVIDWLQWRSCE